MSLLCGGTTRYMLTTMNGFAKFHTNKVSRKSHLSLASSCCLFSTKRAFFVRSSSLQQKSILPDFPKRFYKASLSNQKSSTTSFVEADQSQTSSSSPSQMSSFSSIDENSNLYAASIPSYLIDVYWWAYIHPLSIQLLDCQPIVNMILWGNFNFLRDVALDELATSSTKAKKTQNIEDCSTSSSINTDSNIDIKNIIQGRTLQVACVYGDFTEKLLDRIMVGKSLPSSLNVVDVVPAQLENLKRKLERIPKLRGSVQSTTSGSSSNTNTNTNKNKIKTFLSCSNVANPTTTGEKLLNLVGEFPSSSSYDFDQAIVFFLLHEMPSDVRILTIQNMIALIKPNGGKLVFIDYHRPQSALHRFLLSLVFDNFEPFAKDMWKNEIQDWISPDEKRLSIRKETYCGGLYQKVVVERNETQA